jgi:hypothetical protein
MVVATVAEWLSIPEVPVRVNVALPATALPEAVTVTLSAALGVRLSVAGCAVTPLGSPAIATSTNPINPLAGAAFTLICCPPPPGVSETLAGVAVRLKSPAGAAGFESPPQDTSRSRQRKPIHPAAFPKHLFISKPPARFTGTGFTSNLVCMRQIPCTRYIGPLHRLS